MQTFLPLASFATSARVLDRQRLGKQRVEVLQLLRALSGESLGWRAHPAVRMWRGAELGLVHYGLAVCGEWVGRGYADTCTAKIRQFEQVFAGSWNVPPWLGDESFHLSHRSNLLRKAPEWYRQWWPEDPADLPYVWPAGVAVLRASWA